MLPASGTKAHYEVVDDRDALVGNLKHATEQQARQLQIALKQSGGKVMHVAKVTETVVIQRRVERIAERVAESATARSLAA